MCDTKDMLANCLTKHCNTDEMFQKSLETGGAKYQHLMLITTKAKRKYEYTEGDLERMAPETDNEA